MKAWGDKVLAELKGRARALYRAGRFVSADGTTAVFALPDEVHRSYCEVCREEVEAALGAHFSLPLTLRLVAEGNEGDSFALPGSDPGMTSASGQGVGLGPIGDDRAGMGDSPARVMSVEDRLLRAFPGAEEV